MLKQKLLRFFQHLGCILFSIHNTIFTPHAVRCNLFTCHGATVRLVLSIKHFDVSMSLEKNGNSTHASGVTLPLHLWAALIDLDARLLMQSHNQKHTCLSLGSGGVSGQTGGLLATSRLRTTISETTLLLFQLKITIFTPKLNQSKDFCHFTVMDVKCCTPIHPPTHCWTFRAVM